jgi:hypothetical protein
MGRREKQMRLIDADAFKEHIAEGYEEYKGEFKTDKYRNVAKEATKGFLMGIDEQPTVYDANAAAEALDKQIPKKPDISGNGYFNGELVYDTYTCPRCGKDYELDYEDYDYCPNCGQRIDLSDWKDKNGET